MVDTMTYFSIKSVLHDWCNKGHGMCYPVCGMVNIKETLLLIGKSSSSSGGSRFPLSLSDLSFTICLTLYNHECIIKIKHILPSSHNTSNHPPPATDSGRTARTPLYPPVPLTPSTLFFSCPRQRNRQRLVPVPVTGVRYNSLL